MSAEAAPRTASRKRKTRWAVAAIVVVIVVAVAIAMPFILKRGGSAQAAMQTATASKADLTVTVSADGSTEAIDTTEVQPEVAGTVAEVYVELGDKVKAGDDLFRIDDADLQKEVKTTRNAKNQAAQSVSQAEQAVAQAKLQQMQAQQKLDKLESQTGTRAASSDDLAIAKQELSIAKQSVSASKSKLSMAESDYADAVDTYDEAVEAAKNTVVSAPVAGTITELNVSKGSSVSAGSSGGASTGGSSAAASSASASGSGSGAAAVIADTSELKVSVAVNEADISAVEKGQKANVSFDAVEGLEVSGTVSWVSPSATSGSGVVTYDVYLTLAKQDDRLRPGMSAVADIVTESVDQALVVPKSAVKIDGTTKYVTIVAADGSTKRSEIKTGLTTDDYAQVLSGVAEGDVVVTSSSSDTAASSNRMGGMMFGGPPGGGERPSGSGSSQRGGN